MRRIIIVLLALFSYVGSCNAAESNINVIEFEEPLPLPEGKFIDDKGKERSFEEFENNLVMLNFWATWCTSCVLEMKELDKLQKKIKKSTVKILPISQDFKGLPIVREYYKKMKINFLDIYLDNKNELFRAFNIVGVPTTVIINPKGLEVARFLGVVNWEDPEVVSLLQKYTKDPIPFGKKK